MISNFLSQHTNGTVTECDNANVVVVIRKTFPTKVWQWRQWPTNRIQRFRQPWLEMQRPFRAFFQDGSISYVQWPISPALGTCFCSAKKRCLLRRGDYHHAGYWKSANHSFNLCLRNNSANFPLLILGSWHQINTRCHPLPEREERLRRRPPYPVHAVRSSVCQRKSSSYR